MGEGCGSGLPLRKLFEEFVVAADELRKLVDVLLGMEMLEAEHPGGGI